MTRLREVFQSPSAKVDRENGVIRDVRILGPSSLNGRQYSKQAVQNARELYEGKVVNFDHPHRDMPDAERSVADRAGWLEDVHFKDGGLTGDLHILKADPRAEKICEAAERRPELFGLSHNVEGKTRRENGKTLVEEILRVRSVDVVSDPASTRSLFESIEREEHTMATVTIKELIKGLKGKNRKLPGVRLLREIVDEGVVDEELPLEVEAEPEAEAGVEEQITVALNAAATAVIEDESIGPKETAAKVEEIMVAKENLIGNGEGDGEGEEEKPAEEEEEKPATESRKQKADPMLAQILEGQKRLQKQLTEIKGRVGIEKPKSGMSLTESRSNGDGKKSENAKDFFERVTG